MTQEQKKRFDIVICGAGIAGLTLARQIRARLPQVSILLIDKQQRPLPQAAFKVGESTTEIGAQYFSDTLGLGEYLEECHLRKLGLRFFYQAADPATGFEARPEAGVSRFIPPHGYQIDRGRIEHDLRGMMEADGAVLLEGASVKDIQVAEDDDDHRVVVEDQAGARRRYHGRWVVDALGRHSLMRRRLGLTKRVEGGDAAWARVPRRVDVSDLVSADCAAWHERVPGGGRYYSTNHLAGTGYWVWLIPLAGGFTSIGIVTHPDYHDYRDYNTKDGFRAWLQRHEPALAANIAGDEFSDFLKMPRYSFTSSQVFSDRRWACTGEASAFPDPLYSPNFELIALNNSMITSLVVEDHETGLDAARVAEFNRFLLTYGEGLGGNIRNMYHCFGSSAASSCKVMWDTLTSWSYHGPLYHHELYLDGGRRNRVRSDTGRFLFLSRRIQRLFRDWAAASRGRVRFDYFNFQELPFYLLIRQRGLVKNPDADLAGMHRESLEFFEELAQVVFLVALADIRPEFLRKLPDPYWINVWSIDLDPDRWEAEGLMQPASEPRPLAPILEPLRSMMELPGVEEVSVR